MFEDSFLGRKANGRTRLVRFLLLFISVVLHGLFVYGLFHARFTIKIIAFGPTVRNVRIVPPFKLSVPKIVGPLETETAAGEMPPAGGAGARAGRASRARGAESAPPVPAPGRPGSRGAQSSAVPSLSSKFQQSMASRFKTDQESEFKIVLAPPGSKTGPSAAPAKGSSPDFYKYIPGAVGGSRGGYGTGAARGGRGTGGQRASISIPLKGFNLTPWAQKVLELILKNWNLPPVGDLPERAQVKVVLMISKNGEVSSLELVEGTALDELDQAALKAIRASLPLPALPADFPGDFLEASIEFTYHD